MEKTLLSLTITVLITAFACSALNAAESKSNVPVPLIFDTDIGNDVDDVLALGMIHSLQSRGECELLAVTTTKDHPMAAAFTDVVNTFYGRGDIPIGVCRSNVTPDEGKFIGLAAQMDGDLPKFPHDLKSGVDAPDAVTVLRQTLANARDGSVVIAQVGFSTNLANLIDSKPDTISPLDGKELAKTKVRMIYIMAGAFAKVAGANGNLYEPREFNVVKDIPAAKHLADDWPTPIVWSGFEIGKVLPYPVTSIDQDYGYAQPHPLQDSYRLYCEPGHNRPSWDLTSVLVAIRPDHGYFNLSPPGIVTVKDDGATTFEPNQSGRHRYFIIPENGHDRILEALTLLSSQPPQ